VKCDELLRLLTEYEDGALAGPLCVEVDRHLRECAPCEGLRAELQELSRLCRREPPARLPDALRRRLERMLRGEA